MLTFLVALTVLFSAKVITNPTKPSMWAAVPIGLYLGLATATKMTALILLGVVVIAYTLRCGVSHPGSIWP